MRCHVDHDLPRPISARCSDIFELQKADGEENHVGIERGLEPRRNDGRTKFLDQVGDRGRASRVGNGDFDLLPREVTGYCPADIAGANNAVPHGKLLSRWTRSGRWAKCGESAVGRTWTSMTRGVGIGVLAKRRLARRRTCADKGAWLRRHPGTHLGALTHEEN
jgi:hypothetical protein